MYEAGAFFGGLAGVARLARNPGDHLLRNKSRWASPGNVRSERTQRAACERIEAAAVHWNVFHDHWYMGPSFTVAEPTTSELCLIS